MDILFKNFADNKNSKSKSFNLRKKRFHRFLGLLEVSSSTSILDVGGTETIWKDTGLEKNVTLLNVSFSLNKDKNFTYIEGDACNMHMFRNCEFDVIFSNSVIEHVGGIERQRLFAKEVQRVSKKYWVQTPNKFFPIEPHFLFPLFQFFPRKLQEYIGLRWKYSHLKRNNEDILDELSRLNLLTCKKFKLLFQDAKILKEEYLFFTKSLIAYKS